jgi:uncharacterized protein YbcV (DUF1398 family)
MNTKIIAETARKTLDGTMSFPEVVGQLLTAGVEYYQVDYVGMKKTFYSAEGDMVVTPINYEGLPPVAPEFSLEAVHADILDSQRNGQKYRDFTRRAMEAGVQGYFAFLRGKRVTYFGRQGDEHTEWFPNAQPAQFTEQDIRAAYAKTRTGADFPRLIRDLKTLGIVSYDHLLETGSNIFHGKGGQSVSLSNMGPSVQVSPQPNLELLKKYISMHQSGLTNYPTLCGQAGEAGVEKWTSDLLAMTCSYFDKSGRKMHVELIPDGEYKKD